MSLSVDTTVSIAHLPSYLSTVASGTATALYNLRASAKITKHAPGCAEQGRSFMPSSQTQAAGYRPPFSGRCRRWSISPRPAS